MSNGWDNNEEYPLEQLQAEYLKGLLKVEGQENAQKAAEACLGMPDLTRQQRRELVRAAKKEQQRAAKDNYRPTGRAGRTFTQAEMETTSQVSYDHGKAFALYAAQQVLGLGDVRLDRVKKEIAELEVGYFAQLDPSPLPFDPYDIIGYKGAYNHAKRKA